jgi:protein farnesyltransferase subunit beta
MLRAFSSPKSPCYVSTPKGKGKDLDVRSLLRWAASVQAMPIEGGGFRGRTNKLVDGCYSWWVGGIFAVLEGLLAEESSAPPPTADLWDRSEFTSTHCSSWY